MELVCFDLLFAARLIDEIIQAKQLSIINPVKQVILLIRMLYLIQTAS